MVYTKRVSLMMGLAAMVSVGGALPAQAGSIDFQDFDTVFAPESIDIALDTDFPGEFTQPSVELASEVVPNAATSLPAAEQPVELSPEVVEAITDQTVQPEVGVNTSADALMASPAEVNLAALSGFDSSGIEMALASGTVAADGNLEETVELAQSTRSAYRGVSPAYIGVGGNLGFGNREDSGVASMGFSLISKVSLGPRFSLRPGVLFTNQSTSFTVPLTYNFNLYELGGFRFQPYVGAGVDIPSGSDVGLLINGGIDMPISRDFTLNAVTNWRVTSGFGFGLTVGVGYNFPWIFE